MATSFLEKLKKFKNRIFSRSSNRNRTSVASNAPAAPANYRHSVAVVPAQNVPERGFDLDAAGRQRPFSAMMPATAAAGSSYSRWAERPKSEISAAHADDKMDSTSNASALQMLRPHKPRPLVIDNLEAVEPPLRSSSKRYSAATASSVSGSPLASPALSNISESIERPRSSSLSNRSSLPTSSSAGEEQPDSSENIATVDNGQTSSYLASSGKQDPLRRQAVVFAPKAGSAKLTPVASLMYEMRRNAYVAHSGSDDSAADVSDREKPTERSRPLSSPPQAPTTTDTTFSDEINNEIGQIMLLAPSVTPYESRRATTDFRNVIISRQESTSLELVLHPRTNLRRKSSSFSSSSSAQRSNSRSSVSSQRKQPPRSLSRSSQSGQDEYLLEDFPWLQAGSAGPQLDEQPVTWIEFPSGFTREMVARMCASPKWRQRVLRITECNGTITMLQGSRRICVDGGSLVLRHKLLRVAHRWFRDHRALSMPILPEDSESVASDSFESSSTMRRRSHDSVMSTQTNTTSLSSITPPSTPPLSRDEREFMKQASIFVNYDHVHM